MSFNDFDQQLYTTLTSGNYSSDHDYSNQLFELEEADRILNRLIDPLIGGATRSSTTSPTSFVLRQLSTSSTEMTKKPPTQLDFPSPVARMNSQDFANFASAYLADGKLPTMNTPSVEHKALPSSGVESSRLNYGNIEDTKVNEVYEADTSASSAPKPTLSHRRISPRASAVVNHHPSKTTTYHIVKAEAINHDSLQEADEIDMDDTTPEHQRYDQRSSSAGPIRTSPRKSSLRRTHLKRQVYTPDSVYDGGRASGTSTPNSTNSAQRPRPYRVRPADERDDKWREKRDRNNESVRKAREKARDEQKRRDDELQDLRDQNTELLNENASLREQVAFLQELNKARH